MRLIFTGWVLAATGGGLLPACQRDDQQLEIGDLTDRERFYIQRVVVLERAKAVSLVDSRTGFALLDSLATAWGDSSLEQTLSGAPDQPGRSALVNDLLRRILTAERDSLIMAPRPDRLAAPLPSG